MTEKVKPAKTAVIVIDLQKGNLVNAYDVEGVVERTAKLVERARSENVPVIWVQHNDEELPLGSPEWEMHDALVPEQGENKIDKVWSDSFQETGLEEILRELGIERLVIAGAATDFCIRNTWHSALQRGFDTVLVEDAHTTESSEFDGVALPAETIIQFTNRYAYFGSEYPGRTGTSAKHDEIILS